jgi:hypothetical protein
MVAVPVAVELHEPPVVPSVRVVVRPLHTILAPPMVAGAAFTVATVVAAHPLMV